MYISNGLMMSHICQVRGMLNSMTSLHLYTGSPPDHATYRANGFVFADYAGSLLGTVALASAFKLSAVVPMKEWRFNLVSGNKVISCTQSGVATYAVLNNGTGQPRKTIITSVGITQGDVVRLDSLNAVAGGSLIWQTFNFNIKRNLIA